MHQMYTKVTACIVMAKTDVIYSLRIKTVHEWESSVEEVRSQLKVNALLVKCYFTAAALEL